MIKVQRKILSDFITGQGIIHSISSIPMLGGTTFGFLLRFMFG
jgi:hypothetical protein